MQIVQKKVLELIPYINNARTHSEEQVAQIAASIKEFGFTNPILTDGDNGVIAGHGRVLAARKLGMTELPTIELSHLSPAQKKAYIIASTVAFTSLLTYGNNSSSALRRSARLFDIIIFLRRKSGLSLPSP